MASSSCGSCINVLVSATSPSRDNSQRMRSPAMYSLNTLEVPSAQSPTPASPAKLALKEAFVDAQSLWGPLAGGWVHRHWLQHTDTAAPLQHPANSPHQQDTFRVDAIRVQHRKGSSSCRCWTNLVLSLRLTSIFPFLEVQPWAKLIPPSNSKCQILSFQD